MAKTKSVVRSAASVELTNVRAEMKVLRERAKFLMETVATEKFANQLSRAAKANMRKAETIAKLKEKLAALEAA